MTSPFRHIPGVFARVDVQPLIEGLAWEQRSSRFYGREVAVPRLLAMYGSAYDYSGIRHPAAVIPPVLEEVRVEVEAMTGRRFNSVLCNLYRDGSDSVGWHSDDDYASGEQPMIASVSLGETRRFRVRTKAREGRETRAYDLAHGDVVVMGDGAQATWEHCVPKTSRVVGPRVNLTYRWITAEGAP